jgi:hypothetical protein
MQINLTQKLELAFWDVIIYRLSRYTIFRRLMNLGYRLAEQNDLRSFAQITVLIAVIGFFSGFLTTILFSVIF